MTSCFAPGRLQGRNALITGGSSGINKAIARRFLEHGARVVIVARDRRKLDEAERELAAGYPDSVLTQSADVRDLAALEAAAQAGAARFGQYGVVVAGAAGNFLSRAEELSSNAFAAVIDIDLKGTFHTFRACHPHLAARAHLIAISAPQASVPMALQVHATAAKAGIEMLVKSLAVEWGGLEGARVNALSPGLVAGTHGADIFCQLVGAERLTAGQPVPRLATLDEVADAALFLACDLADYITGHTLAIDGGLTLESTAGANITAAARAALLAAGSAPRRKPPSQ
jgi:NAD(P)-dependent dehydrogenase (short-subunit alcohol dehydrogenase family)